MGEVGWNEWLSMMSSLAVVLVLLGATLFGLKKMGLSRTKDATKNLNVSEVHNLGPRQKLIVITINNEQVLLGVTPQAINRLGNWPEQEAVDDLNQSIDINQLEPDFESPSDSPGKFQQLMSQVAKRTAERKKH
ncbi:flagellar biosynthetic protein FliO [SAR92 clade bacterium H455]|uniref:Flagellar biosynthetic protein FliO n=1 Tax=SAR92 clade bacterium H455 TaxID=2974818 RepID=A0ABY5TN45_9GAMM|nr:flagellar biosynthetic protein FliO [SAR92 clade bacterium H455]